MDTVKINRRLLIIALITASSLLLVAMSVLAINSFKKPETKTVEISCKRAGCSGQLCVDSNSQDVTTTCEWKKEYGCLQKANCEVQTDGKCGFTKNQEYQNCMSQIVPQIKRQIQ